MITINQSDTGQRKLVGNHWLKFRSADNYEVIQISGIALVQFPGLSPNWSQEVLHICRDNPYCQQRPSPNPGKYSLLHFKPESWSVYAALAGADYAPAAMVTPQIGWHIDNFSLPSAGQPFTYGFPIIEVKFAARSTAPAIANLWSVAYSATFVCSTYWEDEVTIN